MPKRLSKKYFTKFLFAIIFFSLFFFNASRAAAWETYASLPMQTFLEQALRAIAGLMRSMLKQSAFSSLNQQINSLVGGSSSKNALIITDWEDYIVKQSVKTAKTYINDYISQTTKGKGSSSYVPAGYEGVNSGSGSYLNQLQEGAKALTSEAPETPQITYTGEPSQMFDDGTFKGMSSYLSGINNPWAYNLRVESAYQKKIEELKQIAVAEGTANEAFKSQKEGNKVITPGSLIKENTANAQDLGNKILAGATDISEIITAVVSQMITKTISQGIGGIQSSIKKEVNSTVDKAAQEMKQQVKNQGPSALYK